MRIVQHKMDPAKWIQHFKEQAMGVKHPTQDGYVFLNNQRGKGAEGGSQSTIKLVSPVQRVVEQARAEVKRGIKRKASSHKSHFKKRVRRGKTSKKSKTKKKRLPKKKSASKKKKQSKKRDIFGK